ncbi:hypothetical protein, partial [Rossellomorea marisflavi]|uniref:hypothetical protein n=1 Tax=Rossellomorea marisflavi TaxID=189381 RepID=UPI003518CB86
ETVEQQKKGPINREEAEKAKSEMDDLAHVSFRCGRPLSGGEGVEPLRLRLQGLKLPSFPAGVGHPPLLFTFWWNGCWLSLEVIVLFLKVTEFAACSN